MRKALLALVLLVAALTGVAPRAQAGPAGCGSVVTEDTVLTEDLQCDGDGLVIGAGGVTVDLGGHTILGPRTPGSKGIENPGFDDVTITNGIVGDFGWGIELRKGAERNRITQMTAAGLQYGLVLSNSHGNTVGGGTFENGYLGGEGFGAGIALFKSHDNLFQANRSVVNSDNAIVLVGSNGNTIEGTEASWVGADGNGGYGLLLLDSDRNQVGSSTFAENVEDGIHLDRHSGGNRLAGNLVANNGGYGIRADTAVEDGGGNRAFGNRGGAQCAGVPCADVPADQQGSRTA